MRVPVPVVTASSCRRPGASQPTGTIANCSQYLSVSCQRIGRVRQPSDHSERSYTEGGCRAGGLAEPDLRPRWHWNDAPIGRPGARRNGTRNPPESKLKMRKERQQNGIATPPRYPRRPKRDNCRAGRVKPGFQSVRTHWNQGFIALAQGDAVGLTRDGVRAEPDVEPSRHPEAQALHGCLDEAVGQSAAHQQDQEEHRDQEQLRRHEVLVPRPRHAVVDLDQHRVQQVQRVTDQPEPGQ